MYVCMYLFIYCILLPFKYADALRNKKNPGHSTNLKNLPGQKSVGPKRAHVRGRGGRMAALYWREGDVIDGAEATAKKLYFRGYTTLRCDAVYFGINRLFGGTVQ
jgi:hypothetical protein